MKHYKFGADSLHPEFKRFVYGYHSDPDRPAAVPAVIATDANQVRGVPVVRAFYTGTTPSGVR